MTTSLPLDHSGLGVLPQEECLYRLSTARVGRLSFFADGYPTILPVNHGMDGDSVIFRTSAGSKLSAAENGMPVGFEVDGIDVDRRAGWSVLVRGDAHTVDDPTEIARLDQLGVWPWADGSVREFWVRIEAREMTGRKLMRHGHA